MDLRRSPVDAKIPILETFVSKNGIEALTSMTVWNDSKVKDFKLGLWVKNIRCGNIKVTPTQMQRIQACGVQFKVKATRKMLVEQDQEVPQKDKSCATRNTRTEQKQEAPQKDQPRNVGNSSNKTKSETTCEIAVDWNQWFKASKPQKIAMLSKHYPRVCLLKRQNWRNCDFILKLVIFAKYLEQHEGNARVPYKFVDQGTNFRLGYFVANLRYGHARADVDKKRKLDALGFVWGWNKFTQATSGLAFSNVQSETAINEEEQTIDEGGKVRAPKRKREKPDRYKPAWEDDNSQHEESSICTLPDAKAHQKATSLSSNDTNENDLSQLKGEEGGDDVSQLKGEEGGDDVSLLKGEEGGDEVSQLKEEEGGDDLSQLKEEESGDDLSRLAEKYTTRAGLEARITYIREMVKKASYSLDADFIEQAMKLNEDLEPLQSLRNWDKFRSVEELEHRIALLKQELQTIDGNVAFLQKRCELAKELKCLQERIALENQETKEKPTNAVCFC